MLRTNSKKAIDNIKKYIIECSDFSNYPELRYIDDIKTSNLDNNTIFNIVAHAIWNCFISEKYSDENSKRYFNYNRYVAFRDWAQGLPSALDTLYYWNRFATNDLGKILEETQEERERYTEEEAEELLTKLLYREITKGVKRHE